MNKDLVIGDWVLCNGTPMKLNIGQIHNLVCETKWARTHKCEPIPLTEEILEENGYKLEKVQERIYKYVYFEGNCFVEVFLFESNCVFNVSNKIEIGKSHGLNSAHICGWFVHELQHALRLCGLNDLADNFKVD